MSYLERNRKTWNDGVMSTSVWARPVDEATIAAARAGRWDVLLTPRTPVPEAWLSDIEGKDVLCLASGGGQQAPILAETGELVVRYTLPYSDEERLTAGRLAAKVQANEPIEFGHALTAQIGGQTSAGFLMAGLYEDHWYDDTWLFSRHSPVCIATLAVRPR